MGERGSGPGKRAPGPSDSPVFGQGGGPGSGPGTGAPRHDPPCGGFTRLLGSLYLDAMSLALVPPVALAFDYSMTFRLAGSPGTVLSSEASPVVRLFLGNNLMVAFFLSLLALYFLASLAALSWLHGTRYYPFGVMSLLIVGAAHVLGGISWILRSPIFSLAIGPLVTFLFLLAALFIGKTLFTERVPGEGS